MTERPHRATGEVLWRPDPAAASASPASAFLREVERATGRRLAGWDDLHRWSLEEPERFWSLLWDHAAVIAETRGETVLAPGRTLSEARWFPDARLSFAENLLRRRDGADAIVFRAEDGRRARLSFAELHAQVARLAAGLRGLGLRPGDHVAAWMPNVPATVVAMLAATSLGLVWSSCSPDFGVDGVLDRFGAVAPRVLFAADGALYGGRAHDLRPKLRALAGRLPSLERVVLAPYLEEAPDLAGIERALPIEELMADAASGIAFEPFPFNHPLYVLFSSGTTGRPKCIVHGAGGTLLQHLKEHRLHTGVGPGDRFFYFTTCGWMMWNWLVSGLASEATLLLYDGSPLHPAAGALFDLADQESMTILGTSARTIDAWAKAGLEPRRTHRLTSLRTILSTGSPLAPESFDYVYAKVKADVRLSSISGGTDIVSCFALGSPLLPVRRGELQCRGLGMDVRVFDEGGRSLVGEKGELVCAAPFPSMPLGFGGDPGGARFRAAYFERFPGVWHHGDFVELRQGGGMVFHGRSDAVLNPGGVRIGTAEIYRQVEQVPEVLESVAVGQSLGADERIVLFVRLREGLVLDAALEDAIRRRIRDGASPRHVPAVILAVPDVPRTRSGKIVELAIRDLIHGRPVTNVDALANPEALDHFRDRPELR